jgi:serine phosphatase RsbU (regulator of sigma subunit)/ligand-binding sensor domain-containing protein
MKKIQAFLLFVLIHGMLLHAQINKYGIPLIRNYTPQEYESVGEQNWAAVQDYRGVMYFGNNDDGVLEYDGNTWRQIKIPNKSIVRSLAIDSFGTIYVGAVDEFGYLAPDKTGLLQYVSLSSGLDSTRKKFADVYKTYTLNNKVYFCTTGSIFIVDHHNNIKTIELPQYSFLTFVLENRIFIGNYDFGLLELKKDTTTVVAGGRFFNSKDIVAILPSNQAGDVLVCTNQHGVFTYNLSTGKVRDDFLSAQSKKILIQNGLYQGILMPGNYYAFATLYGGTYIVDSTGYCMNLFDKKIGLQDETIFYTYNRVEAVDQKPLWFALNQGISRTELFSPFRKFGEESGLKGAVLDVVKKDGVLYVATSTGVFILTYNTEKRPVFKQVQGIDVYSWSFLLFKDKKERLIVGTQGGGLFEIIGDKAHSINKQFSNQSVTNEKANTVFKLFQSRKDPENIFVGSSISLIIITNQNGKLDYKKEIKVQNEVRSIEEDEDGNIWVGTYFDGVVKIENPLSESPRVLRYDSLKGLPSLKDVNIYSYDKRLLFITNKGIYEYNKTADRIIPCNFFGKRYCDGSRGVFRMFIEPKGDCWLECTDGKRSWIEYVQRANNTFLIQDTIFRRLPSKQMDAIMCDNEGVTWFGISNFLYSYNPHEGNCYIPTKNVIKKFNALIRKVTCGDDSIIFHGTYPVISPDSSRYVASLIQPDELKTVLKYRDNNVVFEFAAPFFEEESANQFSYKLEGFSSNWSKWNKETKAVFTNLPEGDYIFKVKSKNIYGVESTVAQFEFTILPPWYRTIWTYISYVILSILLVAGIVKYNARRLIQEKIQLEGIVRERTAEVVKQKEEIEEQKGEIEKQRDTVMGQRDLIMAQKKDITDSIQYASRIQRALLPSENLLNQNLPENFVLFRPRDIVSGDFYWMSQKGSKSYVVAADCTGHGVPGAFMSMLGISFLNQIVNVSDICQADLILNELREHIIKAFKQSGQTGETKDGMDLALCVIDWSLMNVQYAGANNSLYYVRPLTEAEKAEVHDESNPLPDNVIRNEAFELIDVKADRMPIGYSLKDQPFALKELGLASGTSLYISSDGYLDQFGGADGKKFMSKKFKQLLLKIQGSTMQEQREILNKTIDDWRGEIHQIDDVLVIGIRIP